MKTLNIFKNKTKKETKDNVSITSQKLNKTQLAKVIGGADSTAIIGKGGKEVDKLKEEIK